MTDDERRQLAWNHALNAEGTRVVFERRASALQRLTRLRDFIGLAVPVLVAYLAGSEIFEPLKPYKDYAIGLLGVAVVLQALLALWSLIARWDEELAYNVRSARESYSLKEAWKRLGQGQATNLGIEFDLLTRQQEIVDSHDAEKGITDGEKRRGMRAGLIEFQRQCVCGQRPLSRKPPWWKKHPCVVCGGN